MIVLVVQSNDFARNEQRGNIEALEVAGGSHCVHALDFGSLGKQDQSFAELLHLKTRHVCNLVQLGFVVVEAPVQHQVCLFVVEYENTSRDHEGHGKYKHQQDLKDDAS